MPTGRRDHGRYHNDPLGAPASSRSGRSATLVAAHRASDSVQPLSVVLARNPWIRVLSLSRAASSGRAVMEAFPKEAEYVGKYNTTMGSLELPDPLDVHDRRVSM